MTDAAIHDDTRGEEVPASRAPQLMQRLGLEWIYRFLQAPRRLFRRYFIKSWRFIGLAMREQMGRRAG